jgi:hypothetical protein
MRLSILVGMFLLGGCAAAPAVRTGTEGKVAKPVDPLIQEVAIQTVAEQGQVNDVRCSARNDKGVWEVTAPGKITVTRSAKALEVTCLKDGFIVALQKSESGGDVVRSAATGAVVGGAVSALAAAPLLAVPVVGLALYAGAVGGSALLGGTVNAAVDHSQGTVYVYPAVLTVRMSRDNSGTTATRLEALPPPLPSR